MISLKNRLSEISWTGMTLNPVAGCTKIGPGCTYCYANDTTEMKLLNPNNKKYVFGFRVMEHSKELFVPQKLDESALIFICSMGDLFHTEQQKDIVINGQTVAGGKVSPEFIKLTFSMMNLADNHIFQVLTKRPNNILPLINELEFREHVHIGVSVENEKMYFRIDTLKKVPSKIRFLSIEPLLGQMPNLYEQIKDGKISWVIVGGESYASNPKDDEKIREKREMRVEWVMEIREQCLKAGVPFFFKQYTHIGSRKPTTLLPTISFMSLRRINILI